MVPASYRVRACGEENSNDHGYIGSGEAVAMLAK